MTNQECPMCEEVGWGLEDSNREELTIKMYCTMCEHVMVVYCHNGEDFHKTLVKLAKREMRAGVMILGQEIMDKTGWDDCATFALIRDEANKQIPEGC